MKITVIGVGYVGLVTGACFSDLGNDVICLDVDSSKIENLNKGIMPIYEQGLKDLVNLNVQQERLTFTTDVKFAIENSDVIFIAVGTPQDEEGKADLKYVKEVAKTIGTYMNTYKVIVNKSTVPVGTGDLVKSIIKNETDHEFDVVSNPEFLKEGAAIKDFMTPDRVVLGVENEKSKEIMLRLYKSLERVGKPIVLTDVRSAELIKYASNAMLATRISFMNELSRLSEKVNADIKKVARGIGLDDRIGPRFLHAGVGYGGSCFPKDIRALINTGKENQVNLKILQAVDDVNEEQKKSIVPKVSKLVGDLSGKKIAVWGLAFKPKTDDVRDAPALVIVKELLDKGCIVFAFDPVAQHNFSSLVSGVEYAENPYDILQDADCLLILTEWDLFRELDFDKVKSLMKNLNLVDGRNIYDPEEMKEFNYIGVGR